MERTCNHLTKDKGLTRFNQPATNSDILEVENKLSVNLPSSLKNLLLEFNGDNFLLFSTKEIVESNLMMRDIPDYSSMDGILFFATNGFGDFFGYQIEQDRIKDEKIYMWDHESNDTVFAANDLDDVVKKYYLDKYR